MTTDQPIILKRDCPAVMVPSGEPLALHAGGKVWLTQALGGGYTVMTDHGYTVRVDGRDGDALGLSEGSRNKGRNADSVGFGAGARLGTIALLFRSGNPSQYRRLGLIYDCQVEPLPGGGHKATSILL